MNDDSLERILRRLNNKYYGKYRGFVADNADPEKRGRLKLQVPSVLGDNETDWALPCLPFGGLSDQGVLWVPEVDAQVWVEFEGGNLNDPIWTGTFWPKDQTPPSEGALDPPSSRVFKTPGGHLLHFEDAEDHTAVTLKHAGGARLHIDPQGTIDLTDQGGATLKLDVENNQIELLDANGNKLTMTATGTTVEDSNGNQITMAASGINLKGQQIVIDGTQISLGGAGGEPIIKGQSFLTLFATHVHPTGVGPSGPPLPQGEFSSLSNKVLTN